VAKYRHLSWTDLDREYDVCARDFYSYPHIIGRVCGSLWRTRKPVSVLASLVSNLSYRSNELAYREKRAGVNVARGEATDSNRLALTCAVGHESPSPGTLLPVVSYHSS
jgi:hypothetical protein